MLQEDLLEVSPSENYQPISDDCIFVGVKIKNKYDEERLCIKDDYSPERYKIDKLGFKLYGITKEIPNSQKQLVSILLSL